MEFIGIILVTFHKFQVHSFIIQRLYTLLCALRRKSGLLPPPCIWPPVPSLSSPCSLPLWWPPFCCLHLWVCLLRLFICSFLFYISYKSEITRASHAGVSKLWPAGRMQPRMAMNTPQHKTLNLLKTFFFWFCSSVFISVCVFNVWPKTTLLPVWPRDTKRLDSPVDYFT